MSEGPSFHDNRLFWKETFAENFVDTSLNTIYQCSLWDNDICCLSCGNATYRLCRSNRDGIYRRGFCDDVDLQLYRDHWDAFDVYQHGHDRHFYVLSSFCFCAIWSSSCFLNISDYM